MPGGNAATTKLPASLDWTSLCSDVPAFVTVTSAATMTWPVGSVTVPDRRPDTCAQIALVPISMQSSVRARLRKFMISSRQASLPLALI